MTAICEVGGKRIANDIHYHLIQMWKELVSRSVFKHKNMKVFKFYCGETMYAFAAETKELAINEFEEQTGDQFTSIEEIPESEWNEKTISMWEDNNFDNEPFKVSINDIICGKEPQMIFTNDYSNF